MTFEYITKRFEETIGFNWLPEKATESEFKRVVASIGEPNEVSKTRFADLLCEIVCDKLDLYNKEIKFFIDTVAKKSIFFNYQEKLTIRGLFLKGDKAGLSRLLRKRKLNDAQTVVDRISIYSNEQIIGTLSETIKDDQNYDAILNSVFSALVFSLFERDAILSYYTHNKYRNQRFYSFLKERYPVKYEREHALSILKVDDTLLQSSRDYSLLLSTVCNYLQQEYKRLQNYCYTGIIIDPLTIDGESIQWRLYSDLVLYATKFIEERLKIGYFHPAKIQETTKRYIPNIDLEKADFSIANTGFTYKDCFILNSEQMCQEGDVVASSYRILVLFQKNKRDEEIIPCPECLSDNVRGNSYPILGVKSWECHNPLCPDKSKYNRGKRYSMSSIIKQEAIEDPSSTIDKNLLSEWRLDVISQKGIESVIDYLIRFYSFFGDTVHLYNMPSIGEEHAGRFLTYTDVPVHKSKKLLDFFDSAFFHRFSILDESRNEQTFENISEIDGVEIYNGNCRDVLQSMPCNRFDGAITSPPYYNAKEYSHWPNIYCYLYDMYNHAAEVYRTLKPGAYFLYNIFDYFDNENNVVQSAMGEGRMILGAYIINLFRKIGFTIQDNIIWYKGHIQGHRSTNQGNNSPYYQAPLNCYEHILCFRKPGKQLSPIDFPKIVNIYPVIKIVKGVNILGHTAPYPIQLARILTSRIKGVVLDPYAGSFTTSRAACLDSINSVSIEMSKEYCQLGKRLLAQQENTLFKFL